MEDEIKKFLLYMEQWWGTTMFEIFNMNKAEITDWFIIHYTQENDTLTENQRTWLNVKSKMIAEEVRKLGGRAKRFVERNSKSKDISK